MVKRREQVRECQRRASIVAEGNHHAVLPMLVQKGGVGIRLTGKLRQRYKLRVAYHVRLSLTAGALVEVADAIEVPDALVPVPVEVVGVPATGF